MRVFLLIDTEFQVYPLYPVLGIYSTLEKARQAGHSAFNHIHSTHGLYIVEDELDQVYGLALYGVPPFEPIYHGLTDGPDDRR